MRLLHKGNFRLTKFASNDKGVLAAIPAEDGTVKDLGLEISPLKEHSGCNGTLSQTALQLRCHFDQNKSMMAQDEGVCQH